MIVEEFIQAVTFGELFIEVLVKDEDDAIN